MSLVTCAVKVAFLPGARTPVGTDDPTEVTTTDAPGTRVKVGDSMGSEPSLVSTKLAEVVVPTVTMEFSCTSVRGTLEVAVSAATGGGEIVVFWVILVEVGLSQESASGKE